MTDAAKADSGLRQRTLPGGLRYRPVERASSENLEEILYACEVRLRLITRAIGEALWDSDLLTGEQEWDGAIEALFGYPAHHGTSSIWWEERIHPDDRRRVLSGLEAAYEGAAEMWSDEYRFRRSDGAYATVAHRGYVVRDEEGRAVRVVGAMADITERRRVEEELRQSEERFRSTFETANVGMAHAAPDGRWLRVNAKMCEILGREREEFMEMTFWDLTPPEELDAARERVGWMLEGRLGPYSVERRFVRRDSSRVWMKVSISLVRKASRLPHYFVCVVEDITERKIKELVPDPLTDREMDVLRCAATGLSNPQIAMRLPYSLGTVKLDMRRLLRKLGADSRWEMVGRAVEIGLVPPRG